MDSRTALFLILSLTAAEAAAATPPGELRDGARVRLRIDGNAKPLVARFETETEDAIVVRTGSSTLSRLRIARTSIDTIDVAAPRGGGGTAGILAGAALGLGISGEPAPAAAGAIFSLPAALTSSAVVSHGGSVGSGILAGTAASTGLGLALGLAASSGDGWLSGDEMIAIGAVTGAVFGLVSATAAATFSRPRWVPVSADRVRVGAAVGPVRRGVAAQVSLSF